MLTVCRSKSVCSAEGHLLDSISHMYLEPKHDHSMRSGEKRVPYCFALSFQCHVSAANIFSSHSSRKIKQREISVVHL